MTEPNPVARRRTFAIISHPDAGKTTLTEKILLFGGAACTYGGGRLLSMYLGDPPRHVVKRVLRALCAPGAPCNYVAHYDMNHTKPERRAAFLKEVEARFGTW